MTSPVRRRGTTSTWCVLVAAGLLPAAAFSQDQGPRPTPPTADQPTRPDAGTVSAPTQPARPAATTQHRPPPPGPATRPASAASRPSQSLSADEMLSQMLKPPTVTGERPLSPVADPPAVDRTSGRGAVAPTAPVVNVLREGTFIVDRVGRLTRAPDGGPSEFTFDSDGKAMRDPPVVIVPNLKLMAMEDAVVGANRDLRFKVSGLLTEYRGRNFILLEKVVVVPDNETFRDF